jgi:hypothetical protein
MLRFLAVPSLVRIDSSPGMGRVHFLRLEELKNKHAEMGE